MRNERFDSIKDFWKSLAGIFLCLGVMLTLGFLLIGHDSLGGIILIILGGFAVVFYGVFHFNESLMLKEEPEVQDENDHWMINKNEGKN